MDIFVNSVYINKSFMISVRAKKLNTALKFAQHSSNQYVLDCHQTQIGKLNIGYRGGSKASDRAGDVAFTNQLARR